jgi:hypothetical protein
MKHGRIVRVSERQGYTTYIVAEEDATKAASEAISLQVVADFDHFLNATRRSLELLNSGHSHWANLPKRENRARLCARIDGQLAKLTSQDVRKFCIRRLD